MVDHVQESGAGLVVEHGAHLVRPALALVARASRLVPRAREDLVLEALRLGEQPDPLGVRRGTPRDRSAALDEPAQLREQLSGVRVRRRVDARRASHHRAHALDALQHRFRSPRGEREAHVEHRQRRAVHRARRPQVERPEPAAVQRQVALARPHVVGRALGLPRRGRQERAQPAPVQPERQRLVRADRTEPVEHTCRVRTRAAREVRLDPQVRGRALPRRASRRPAQLLDLRGPTSDPRPPRARRPALGLLREDRGVRLQCQERRADHPRLVATTLEAPTRTRRPVPSRDRVAPQERALRAAQLALGHLARQPLVGEHLRRLREDLVRHADEPRLEQHLAAVPQRGGPNGPGQAARRGLHRREGLRQAPLVEVQVAEVVLGLEHQQGEPGRLRTPSALLVVRPGRHDVAPLAVQGAAVQQGPAAVDRVRDLDLLDRGVERHQGLLLPARTQREQAADARRRRHDPRPGVRGTRRDETVELGERRLRPAARLELALRELHERARPHPHAQRVGQLAALRRTRAVQLGERRHQPAPGHAGVPLGVVRLRERDVDRDALQGGAVGIVTRQRPGVDRSGALGHGLG
ncbi:MAG: hypothetical protein NVV66_06130 [Cellulomonas sp.]|uniref:hypothetical protein n=1 Tax=Cellulomonas sp. TaxID=40001 RepID=UPI00258E78BB|nr:hypothetical protein [Cellulomonas sp.]MCR6704275.1 hypothetical protein [Cellulomonas sp.]